MEDSLLHSESAGAESRDDSLLWYAQALWSVRWFCGLTLLVGLSIGVWAATNEASKRTVGLIRGVNPAVGYMHRNYWDGISRTIQAQLRVAGESFRARAEVTVKPDTDPWLVRIEIRHSASGEGRQILSDMLQSLPCVRDRSTGETADSEILDEAVSGELRLIQILNEFEAELARLYPDWEAKFADFHSGLLSDHLPDRVYFNEGMLRLPFEDVPHALRFRRLARAAAEVSRESDVVGQMNPEHSDLPRFIRLQREATRLFLLHWGVHDVFSAAAESHTVVLDNVFESDDSAERYWLKYLFLASLASTGIAFLLAVPWHWLKTNWRQITSGRDSRLPRHIRSQKNARLLRLLIKRVGAVLQRLWFER